MSPSRVIAVLFAATSLLFIAAPRAQADEPCIQVGAVSGWGIVGYNHIVFLTNRCAEPFDCAVSTTVDPEPIHTTVPGSTAAQVIVAVDSRDRVFMPIVKCEPAVATTDT